MPVAQLQGPVDLQARQSPPDRRLTSDQLSAAKREAATDSRLSEVLARAAQDGELGTSGGGQTPNTGKTQLLGSKKGEPKTATPAKSALGGAGQPDLYSWMRQQSELLAMAGRAPTPGGVQGQPGAPAARATGAGGAVLADAMASREPLALSLKTFVGTEASSLNVQLRYAEEAMRAGRYYRAAEAYGLARSIATENPLPALGQCLALLAAGDYIASSSNLFDAIALFRSLGEFEVDMKSFVQDVRLLDTRRADLEKRLALRDNGRLRFLLGFTEYNSGLKKLGVKNMANGMQLLTEQDVDMTAVRRFVESLEAKVGVTRPVPAPPGQ
jgi:hypothetical protein